MSQINVEGIFLQALKWNMTDEDTGEVRSGCKVRIAVPVDGTEYNPTKGFIINEYSAPVTFFDAVDQSMAGQHVVMDLELAQRGKNVKLIPQTIKLQKKAA